MEDWEEHQERQKERGEKEGRKGGKEEGRMGGEGREERVGREGMGRMNDGKVVGEGGRRARG